MGKIVLHYFDARGRGEVIRLVLKVANVEFEDHRFSEEEWPEIQKKSPTGLAPFLETADGTVMTESLAIARYFALEHGLMGSTHWETYLVERAIGVALDLSEEIFKVFFASEEDKARVQKNFQEDKGLKLAAAITSLLQPNLLIAGDSVTLADLFLMNVVDNLRIYGPQVLEQQPKLLQHYEKVCSSAPAVAQWIKTRPQNDI